MIGKARWYLVAYCGWLSGLSLPTATGSTWTSHRGRVARSHKFSKLAVTSWNSVSRAGWQNRKTLLMWRGL